MTNTRDDRSGALGHPLENSWHIATCALIAIAVVTQLVIVINGGSVLIPAEGRTVSVAERVLRFFSYYTIQSNILSALAAASLVSHPHRDGRTWRVLRVAAVVGMTVTFIIYLVALRPIVHLEGIAKITDIAFHYVAPVMTMLGWSWFGPWPRIDTSSILKMLAWPLAYLIYVLILGHVSGWYPYPFANVGTHGYGRVAINATVIVVLFLLISWGYRSIDRHFARKLRLPAA